MTGLRLEQLNDEEGRLAALSRYRVLDTGPEQAFEKITMLVKSVLDVPICAVSLIAKDRQWFKAIQGLDARQTTRKVAFCDHTIRIRDAFVVEDATLDARFAENPLVTGEPHIRSYAGVPLQTPEGYNLGALCAIDTKPRKFGDDQIAVLTQFGELIVRELEARSATLQDPLTGCLTRQGMLDAMQQRLAVFQAQGERSSLVILDVDHFRSINDRHGHPLGDQVLQRIAQCCQHALRPDQSLGRLGSGIFAAILPGATAYEALACAERLREQIGQLTFADSSVRVTVTCGIAGLQRGDSRDLWLAGAEGALFAAKSRGRNRCVSADKLQ